MKLAFIGYGTIARLALDTLVRENAGELDELTILSRPKGVQRARSMIARIEKDRARSLARETRVVTSLDEVLSCKPDLVVEAAGHGALQAHGARTLNAGIALLVTSAGALADDALRLSLDAASADSGAAYDIIPGAVGGLDILGAIALSGLDRVTYNSRKPPAAWRNTAAETMTDLDAIVEETVFLSGDASRAAREFPQNANVAATIALKGAGFAKTQVNLIADPAAQRNVHELIVSGQSADFTIRIEGHPAPDNPKTSLTTAYSLAQCILTFMRRQ